MGLHCTDLCSCSDHGDEPCDNVTDDEDIEGTDESSSDELEDEEVVECS